MDNDAVLAQMIHDAEAAAEPGQKVGSVISDGSDDGFPAIVKDMTSAGWVYIYDRKTGERSVCNKNMLSSALKKKRGNEFVFTTIKPSIEPVRGTHKCMLHPDNKNRKHYDEMGLPVCMKSNLTSPFQVTRHMQKRHKVEWATIQSEIQEQKEQRDRDFQERMLSQVGVGREFKGTPDAPLYVKEPKTKK